ncbi:hypothetical protein V2G26_017773 [Clonostachys chloroleuca]
MDRAALAVDPPAADFLHAETSTTTDSSLPIGYADQACKECRRRKARCNRGLPTCDYCTKYRRHCLYEKHSRTPLTRKHLTEVETRLEKAEALLRQITTQIPAHLRTWQHDAPAVPPPDASLGQSPDLSGSIHAGQASAGDGIPIAPKEQTPPQSAVTDHDPEHEKMLEGPPVDDFEWSEHDAEYSRELFPEEAAAIGGESPLLDGMGSLSIDDSEGGYLGVASGAALLRLLEPNARRHRAGSRSKPFQNLSIYPLTPQPDPNRHVSEAMIDAYFRMYHLSYPIIHEPTFRAQYSQVIPRPNGVCWSVLAYVVAAIGVWTSASTSQDTLDLALFSQARGMLSFNFLEVGNVTLVQTLTLASNYVQKRDKPNSGYNYSGLASRMAMGLGLHKEFQGWNISPLNMEIRRRVWWTLGIFDIGASITFSRPNVWPFQGVEVAFPLNVNDEDLTPASHSYPPESNHMTPYTAVATQARFNTATYQCYDRVISKPPPTAEEMLHMEATHIAPWLASIPSFFKVTAIVPLRYAHAQAVCDWRLRNLRIIMYRPFVIRKSLINGAELDPSSKEAYKRCLADAKSTIVSIAGYWATKEHNRLSAWYGLYFIFQAALIPCICLRSEPSAPESPAWRSQIITALETIQAMAGLNASCARCHSTILDLCGRYLDGYETEPNQTLQFQENLSPSAMLDSTAFEEPWSMDKPAGDASNGQMNGVLNMMWPNISPLDAADVGMGENTGWLEFLQASSYDDGWAGPPSLPQ